MEDKPDILDFARDAEMVNSAVTPTHAACERELERLKANYAVALERLERFINMHRLTLEKAAREDLEAMAMTIRGLI